MRENHSENKIQCLILVLFFILFMVCRSTQTLDSNFNLLNAHALLTNHNGNIYPYLAHSSFSEVVAFQTKAGVIQQKTISNSLGQMAPEWTLAYPKTPIYLEIPFVWLMNKLGFPVAQDHPPFWISRNEHRLQHVLASLLMAIYSVLMYRLSRLWLSQNAAVFMVLPLLLGSSVLSTLSRTAWTDTWAMLFVMFALHHLAHVHMKQVRLKVVYLTLMLSLAFFCKPIYALSVITCVAWAWRLDRNKTLKIISLGAFFGGLFYAWSQYIHSGGLISNYSFQYFSSFDLDYLLGQLISPSRGILVFWSWVIPLVIAAILLWKTNNAGDRALMTLALFPIFACIAIISFYPQWHGGVAYGPRLNSPILPWLSLIAVITASAWLNHHPQKTQADTDHLSNHQRLLYHPATLGLASLFLALSVIINFYGAMQPKTFYAWHRVTPLPNLSTSDKNFQKIFWDWSDPIFLAGLIRPERYYNFTIQDIDPKKASALTEQIQTQRDLVDFVMGKKTLSFPSTQPSQKTE